MKNAIFLLVTFVCVVRIINYGIYTVRGGNKTGASGLFVIAAITVLSSLVFVMRLRT